MAEATLRQEGCAINYTADAAISGGEVLQLKDGRAAVMPVDLASGALGAAQVEGIYRIAKTADIVFLQGGRVYWDHSANTATYKKVNDRDFYLGRCAADTAGSSSTVDVALNIDPPYDIDVHRDPCLSALAGTAAAGAFGYPARLGGCSILELTATNEAQKVDLMSVDGFAIGSNAIVEAIFRIINDGSNATQDFTIGCASGTHATDFQSVAEFVAASTVGASTNINLQSDDGTTDVAPTDSTYDYTEGSAVANRVEVWFDLRDPSDVQCYVNGILALTATTFTLGGATGPLFLIAHLEKTSGTDVYKVGVDALRCRLGQQ